MELQIKNLTKEFKDMKAVNHVSFTMDRGVYGLLGVNGAGKTTLMRMICTLLNPTSGTILWGGRDIFSMGEEYRRVIGYLPQDFGYYPEFTPEDYLRYISALKGIKPVAAKRRIEDLLRQVGLENVRKKKIKKFSGGMKRRLGIAQAMLNRPRLLILDEPTSGLDPKERIRFRNLISELAEEGIILLSTHIVSDVESIANEILFMREGQIIDSGSPAELIEGISRRVKVWECVMGKQEAEIYRKRYCVSNLKIEAEGARLRILSEVQPCPQAVQSPLSLEDAFLYYFGEKAGEEHVQV
ncbi:ABC transporter ATP-binding protein [Lactonifactor longoviformis]|uniref:ABC-2 type transport system ATP-binding protein n=1 Tax=Lactonifactor longoviformis DSM 17459 TaxID=1122155 RepID=A0A1M4W1T9_9CLOT|nr:ABC transporter ATP-binding protein [Lactonifactor longoviformis]POP34760.1 ABC transporter ATP-binding protein [Lactonifactor longoviformis]SHE75198.1 ABC-2 type transport system ATP-binding protein [Lactonifactor longoviformis DSM 17459]